MVTCNLKLLPVRDLFICFSCRVQYRKQARCWGLTKGALQVWMQSKRWQCTSCIDKQARNAVNDPEINLVSSRRRIGGARRGL
jgi:hypothetical protein